MPINRCSHRLVMPGSYMILQRVSPVTHSVDNCVKHVVVIVTFVLFFRSPVSPINSLDCNNGKPDPPLWHEDSGRRPWENNRRDTPGSISDRHLGDAVHRLVANSLQPRSNRNGSHAYANSNGHQSNRYHDPRAAGCHPAQAARDHHLPLSFPAHRPYPPPAAAYDPYAQADPRADRDLKKCSIDTI